MCSGQDPLIRLRVGEPPKPAPAPSNIAIFIETPTVFSPMGSSPLSDTPYCSASDTAVTKQCMRPETAKLHFAVAMEISPGGAVLVDANGQKLLIGFIADGKSLDALLA